MKLSGYSMVLLSGLLLCIPSDDRVELGPLHHIHWHEVQHLLRQPPPGLVILDVRTPQEFDEGHLSGAHNVNFRSGSFKEKLDRYNRQKPYLIYCREDRRSQQTLRLMQQMGFTRVYRLSGGITQWQAQGLKIVQEIPSNPDFSRNPRVNSGK